MTNTTRYEKVVEAKELLQKFKEEKEEEWGIDVTELLQMAPCTAAMAAVLMASSFSYQSGWCIPSTREALRFYDEAERRISQWLRIPVRYESYDQLYGSYEKFFFIGDEEIIDVDDKVCQQLDGLWGDQDILPLIRKLEKMVIKM